MGEACAKVDRYEDRMYDQIQRDSCPNSLSGTILQGGSSGYNEL